MYRAVTIIAIVVAVLAVALLRRRPAPTTCSGAECRYPWLDSVAARACAVAFLGLVVTGFYDILVMNRLMHGWVLLIHVSFGGAFTAALVAFAFFRAEANAPGVPSGAPGARKASFWLFVLSGVLLIMTAALAMIPWLGTSGQLRIVDLHRWAAVFSVVAAIGYVGLARRKQSVARKDPVVAAPAPQSATGPGKPNSSTGQKKSRSKAVARASRH